MERRLAAESIEGNIDIIGSEGVIRVVVTGEAEQEPMLVKLTPKEAREVAERLVGAADAESA